MENIGAACGSIRVSASQHGSTTRPASPQVPREPEETDLVLTMLRRGDIGTAAGGRRWVPRDATAWWYSGVGCKKISSAWGALAS